MCHAWQSDERLIAASSSGELWLFENYEFKIILPSLLETSEAVTSIVSYSKGFVLGSSMGVMRIFERSDETRECFRCSKTFRIENHATDIVSMSVSPTEENLVCSLLNSQLFTLNLSNADILKEDTMNFELLSTSFHAPGESGLDITGLDLCMRKPLVATCGVDKTVRIWNFIDRSTDLIKSFKEVPYSIALHPSGLNIVVGFSDKLRLMNLLMDDIRTVKEFPIKECTEVQFSHGGQYIAAANSTTIHVYSSYSFDLIATLRAHTSTITSIVWKADDRKLVTCGVDGSLYIWNIPSGTREGEGFMERNPLNGIAISQDMSFLFYSTADGAVKELDAVNNTIRSEITTDVQIGPMALSSSQKFLFCGTVTPDRPGTIRIYKIPFVTTTPEFYEVQCHHLPVTRLKLSNDNQFLFVTGSDGSLCIFETKDLSHRGVNRGREREGPLHFAEEILVTKSDLEEKTNLMHDLKNQVEELTLHNEYQLRLKDMNYKEKIKEVSEKFNAELHSDRTKFFILRDDKRDMEMDYENKLANLEVRQKTEIDDLERTYQSKIQSEKERLSVLQIERDEQNTRWELENQTLVESHTQFLAELTSNYDARVENEQQMQKKLSSEKEVAIAEFIDTKGLVEDDADIEITNLKAKYDTKLQEEREATLRLKGENGIMRKKYTALQKDIEDQRDEIRTLQEKMKDLIENIKGLEKDIHGHKKEIREREETIQDKEKRIYDLKKKNQELEKFKFVLDYKIKELKRQIEPRENEIADMRRQIEEMDQELEHYHRSNASLDLMIGELRLKMEGMQKEIDIQKVELSHGETFIKGVRADLHECIKNLKNGKDLKASIIKVYKKYVQDQLSSSSRGQVNAQQDYDRQRDYLEKSAESLKRKIAKDLEIHKKEKHRLMRENAALTKESNQLRREYKSMQDTFDEHEELAREYAALNGKSKKTSASAAWKKVDAEQQEIEELEARLSYLQKVFSGPVAPSDVGFMSRTRTENPPGPNINQLDV